MKYKRVIISLVLFCVVFAVLAVPFSQWGFDRDDCGVIYHSSFSSCADFFGFFVRNDLHSMVHSSNYAVPPQYFFSVFYRPLTFFWYGLQLPFFGAWAYGYFLVMIAFHALNVVLFFNMIMPLFGSLVWAGLCALLFAFHVSLWVWMGWIAAQPYTISMTFILFATLLFFLYLKSKTWWKIALSVLCFLVALLTFEFVIVYPIFLLMVYGAHHLLVTCALMPAMSFAHYARQTIGHWLVFLLFLALRISLFPINLAHDPSAYRLSLSKFLIDAGKRAGDFKTFIVHALGLSWVPNSIPFLKSSVVLMFIVLLVFCLYRSKERMSLFFFTVSASLFLWPAVLRYFVPRYLYYSLPVFVFVIVFVLYSAVRQHTLLRRWTALLLSLFILINGVSLIIAMHHKIPILTSANQACQRLALDSRITDKKLCFIGVPRDVFWTGLAQHMWLRGADSSKPIYYDMSTFSCCKRDGAHNMSITPIQGGFRLTSLDHQKLWWIAWGGEYTQMGEKQIYSQDEEKLYDFDFILDKKYATMELLFVTWDYKCSSFSILDSLRV